MEAHDSVEGVPQKELEIAEPQSERNIPSEIQSLLADINSGSSIVSLIRPPIERSVMEMNEEKLKKAAPERKGEVLKTIEKTITKLTYEKLNKLFNTNTMTELRDKATNLYFNFFKSRDDFSPNAQRHVLREVRKLFERAQAYSKEYLEYSPRIIYVDNLDAPMDNTVTDIKEKIKKVLNIANDEREKNEDMLSINIFLPETDIVANGGWSWDTEEISLKISKDGQLKGIVIDEKYSHTRYCTSLETLKESYLGGAKLTSSQINLLLDKKLMSYEALTDLDKVLIKNGKSSLRLPNKFIQNGNLVKNNLPILLFPLILPVNFLERKFVGQESKNDMYATGGEKVGPFFINYRLHDYGEDEFKINISTEELSQDESWELIRCYMEVLRAFPRVLRPKKILKQTDK